MYVSENGGYASYKSKLSSTDTSYTISNVQEGKNYKLKIKMYYANNNRGSTSTKYFYSDVVNVPKTTLTDRTPPVIVMPKDITIKNNTNSGATVNYSVSATDNIDESVTVQCSQASGTIFTQSNTTVACTATDQAGNISSVSFNIIIEFFNAIGDAILPPHINEFYGGQPHVFSVRNATGHIVSGMGTMTIGATNTTGTLGVVVAAHSVALGPGETLVEHTAGERLQWWESFTRISDTTGRFQLADRVDATFIPITEPDIVIGSRIHAHDGTIIDVSQGTLNDVQQLAILSIYGNHTHGQGLLLFKNATTHDRTTIFTHMGISTYPSQYGDSGAPIIHIANGDVNLVGVHKGVICEFDAISEGQPLIDVTGTSWCIDATDPPGSPDIHYYKLFSAWENVKESLSIR